MIIVKRDILTVESGIICHIVNCQSKMGSGVAKSIKEKYDMAYYEYIHLCKQYDDFKYDLLGKYQLVKVTPHLHICNIFGQLDYGYDGKRYLDYCALNTAFKFLMHELSSSNIVDKQIYCPYKIGSDRAGGDWDTVNNIISHYFGNVIYCKYAQSR